MKGFEMKLTEKQKISNILFKINILLEKNKKIELTQEEAKLIMEKLIECIHIKTTMTTKEGA